MKTSLTIAYDFLVQNQQFLQIVDAIGSIAAIAVAIGFPVYWYLTASRDYRKKRFANLVNFSLNYFDGPDLQMRTLLELPINEVWPNDQCIRLIRGAVKRTTAAFPFICLKDPKDMQDVNQAALNKLSALFSATFAAKSLGLNVATANYVFAITHENFKVMNTRKLRVLIIREDELSQVQFAPDQRDRSHHQRLITLKNMYELNGREPYLMGKVQLGVPCDPEMQTPTQPIPDPLLLPTPPQPTQQTQPPQPPQPPQPTHQTQMTQPTDWKNPIDEGFMD